MYADQMILRVRAHHLLYGMYARPTTSHVPKCRRLHSMTVASVRQAGDTVDVHPRSCTEAITHQSWTMPSIHAKRLISCTTPPSSSKSFKHHTPHIVCIIIHASSSMNPDLINLELELVESVASGETPRSLEVFAQVVDLLDGGDERVINGLGISVTFRCILATRIRC
jgi:hypothetical protein